MGVGRAVAADFAVVHNQPGLAREGQPRPLQPALRRHFRRRAVRRLRARHDQHALQSEALAQFQRQTDVTVMDRRERAAEDTDCGGQAAIPKGMKSGLAQRRKDAKKEAAKSFSSIKIFFASLRLCASKLLLNGRVRRRGPPTSPKSALPGRPGRGRGTCRC